MVTAPLPPTSLKLIKNYDELHNKFQEIADENGVEYLDYNYINREKSMFTDKDFKDADHLNSSGVRILDNDLIKYIKPLMNWHKITFTFPNLSISAYITYRLNFGGWFFYGII